MHLTYNRQGDNTATRLHRPSRRFDTAPSLHRQPPEGGPTAARTDTPTLRRQEAEAHMLQQLPLSQEQGALTSNRLCCFFEGEYSARKSKLRGDPLYFGIINVLVHRNS